MLDNLTSYMNSSLNKDFQYAVDQAKHEELFSQLSVANILQRCCRKNEWEAKSLVTYRSTPNLADISDETSVKLGNSLYKNKSTECLANAAEHLENFLFNAYQKSNLNEGSKDETSTVDSLSYEQLKRLEDIHKFLNSENTHLVTIRKDSRGLGFSICGGKDSENCDQFSQLIRISKLYPLQPAVASGNLFVGDILLEVNNVDMVGLTNTEALELLRSCGSEVTFKVFRPTQQGFPSLSLCKDFWPIALNSSPKSDFIHQNSESENHVSEDFDITLVKQDGSLGFSVWKNEDSTYSPVGFYVKALVREPAVSDGRIHPGDHIVKVNGVDITPLTMLDAVYFLRNTAEVVTLTLFRPNPPVSPLSLEGEVLVSKPLRWEAMELLNDRLDSTVARRKLLKKNAHRRRNTDTVSSPHIDQSATSSCSSKDNVSGDSSVSAFTDISGGAKSSDVFENEDLEACSQSNSEACPKVQYFKVVLNRRWHTRLGFSLCDPPSEDSILPKCAEVRAVYPGTLAAKDGRIQVKDRLLEVNSECIYDMPASQVVDMLRRKRGEISMIFCSLLWIQDEIGQLLQQCTDFLATGIKMPHVKRLMEV